jgi:hypothetical protein
MIEGALRFPFGIKGKTEVGQPEPIDTDHAGLRVDHGHGVVAAAHPGGAAGVIGAFGMLADHGIKRIIRLRLRPGLNLVIDIRSDGVGREDLAREANGGAKLFPIRGLRHVVEQDARGLRRIGGAQRDAAPAFRPHRADMGLKPVPLRRRLAVITHGDGQEMELDVGIVQPRARADETAGLEIVRCAQTLAGEQPLRADQRLAPKRPIGRKADGLGGGVLDVKLEVILQVRAHARAVGDHGNSVLGQMLARSNSTEHENFRRIDRTGRQDDLGPCVMT